MLYIGCLVTWGAFMGAAIGGLHSAYGMVCMVTVAALWGVVIGLKVYAIKGNVRAGVVGFLFGFNIVALGCAYIV